MRPPSILARGFVQWRGILLLQLVSIGAAFYIVSTEQSAAGANHNDFRKVSIDRQLVVTTPDPTVRAKPVKKSKPVSCEKAREIIVEYAFENVVATSCDGSIYTFSATREGKQFSIQIAALDGNLAQVEKVLPSIDPVGDSVAR